MIFPNEVVRFVSNSINLLISGASFVNGCTGEELTVDFFRYHGDIKDFHLCDLSIKDFVYTQVKLLNHQKNLASFIESVINNDTSNEYNNCPLKLRSNEHKDLATEIDKYLRKLGYRIAQVVHYVDFNYPYKSYKIEAINSERFISTKTITKIINCNDINDQIDKAEDRINKADYDGAITVARSLVEEILVYILEENSKENPGHGDLIKLYSEVKLILKINPRNYPTPLREIASGLNTIIHGISYTRNKMSDSHTKEYKPSKHHARLAVNSAFTLCEFLMESHIYQKELNKKKLNEKEWWEIE